MFSFLTILWRNPLVRHLSAGAAAVVALALAVLWIRDDAADEREDEVRDENEREALKQRVEIEESQNDQVAEADDIRRDAEPSDNVPEWMRAQRETD